MAISMRPSRVIVLVALAGLTLVVITRFASLRELGAQLSGAAWPWIALAFAIHVVFLVGYSALYRLGFAVVGVESGIRSLLPLVLASFFVNTLLPAGGAAAAALFVADANKRGQSGGAAAVGTVLVLLADVGTLLPFLAYGMAYLVAEGKLTAYDVFGLVSFAVFIAGLVGLLVLERQRPRTFRALLGWVERVANALGRRLPRRRQLVSPAWKDEVASQLAEAAAAMRARPGTLLGALGVGVVLHVLTVVTLLALFEAFHQPVPLGPVVVGFGMGIVYFIIGIVPQGLAVVEGVMSLVFTSFGIPGPKAAAVVLVFRALNYWLPLLAGALFVHRIGEAFGGAPRRATP